MNILLQVKVDGDTANADQTILLYVQQLKSQEGKLISKTYGLGTLAADGLLGARRLIEESKNIDGETGNADISIEGTDRNI